METPHAPGTGADRVLSDIELCSHFSAGSAPLYLHRNYQYGFLPTAHCGLGGTVVEMLHEGPLELSYGPDGRLVDRSRCTRDRCRRSCEPAFESALPDS